jgi:pSer/pThr/pTyr-binding forkhead associated (FHA) protein
VSGSAAFQDLSVIGRGTDCALTIASTLVARQHARIRVKQAVPLSHGDELRIGPALLVFCAPSAESTRTPG